MGLKLLRVWITEACNASCAYCMNQTARETSEMSLLQFEQMCGYFKEHGLSMIALMGGEPTVHPQFPEISKVAQDYFETVMLFTNGLKVDTLMSFKPRINDIVIYNFNFYKLWDDKIFLKDAPGKRIVDVVIDHTSDVPKLKNLLGELILKYGNRVEIQLVINNSINIFRHRQEIARNLNSVYDYVKDKYPEANVIFQCGAPVCYTYGLNLPPFVPRTICPDESILIDGDFNIRFCNIYAQKLVPLFAEHNIIPFQIVKNHIRLQSLKNQQVCLEKICKDCILYPQRCNGKCYIAQDVIRRDDIIQNTDLPWIKLLSI